MDKKLIQELKERLEKEKEALEKELNSFAQKDEKLKGDWDTRFPEFNGGPLEEAADEVAEYEARLPIEHTFELRLRDVNLALEKIEKGTYGKCGKCGKEISGERLKAYPGARFCLDCKK
jgi:DnaK suppressor protein